jgi:hypothetical protein
LVFDAELILRDPLLFETAATDVECTSRSLGVDQDQGDGVSPVVAEYASSGELSDHPCRDDMPVNIGGFHYVPPL